MTSPTSADNSTLKTPISNGIFAAERKSTDKAADITAATISAYDETTSTVKTVLNTCEKITAMNPSPALQQATAACQAGQAQLENLGQKTQNVAVQTASNEAGSSSRPGL